MLIVRNHVLQRTETPHVWDACPDLLDRVVWVAQDGTTCRLINIAPHATSAWPILWSCRALLDDMTQGLVRLLEKDPDERNYQPDHAFSPRQLLQRDQAWSCIRDLVTDHADELFDATTRGPLIRAAAVHCGKDKKQIYRYVRRFWQGGQVPNALLPHVERQGGRGQSRPCLPNAPKRGRKTATARATGEDEGVNIDARMQAILQRGIDLYIHRQGLGLRAAFQALSAAAFATDELRNGVLTPVLWPASERPTFAQFRYWYSKLGDPQQALVAREGTRRYQLRHRPVLGAPRRDLIGPGSMVYYDATIGDVYLVSQFNRRRIIGRPVIHILIDLFSHLIVGVAVLLEGPSWVGAMLALENMTLDKVALCAEYGITINEADWPARHVPFAITGDRGELFSKDAEGPLHALHIRIVTTPPYRPDWKPLVERNFRTLNDQVIHWLPGAVSHPRERGDHDYRLDACLTLFEFRQILLHSIVTYNRFHAVPTDLFDRAMLEAQVDPYPRDLWQWGITYRNGQLRQVAQDAMRRCLLPQRMATAQRDGLHFDGLTYTCATALHEHWFIHTSPHQHRRTVPILIDPRTRRLVYLRTPPGTPLEICPVLERDHFWGDGDWYDVADQFALQRAAQQSRQPQEAQAQIDHEVFRQQIITQAQQQTAAERPSEESKAAHLRAIQANRERERDHDRATHAWHLSSREDARSPVAPPVDTATARRLALLAEDEEINH